MDREAHRSAIQATSMSPATKDRLCAFFPMTKILVTGPGRCWARASSSPLRRSSLRPRFLAADPNPLSAGLFWADRAFRVPFADDAAFMDRIRSILSDERPDAVLVGTDVELAAFSQHRAALEAEFGTQVIVSRPEVSPDRRRQFRTFQFLDGEGLQSAAVGPARRPGRAGGS